MPEFLDGSHFVDEILKAEQDTGRRATLKAISQSQGKYSSKRLAELDHPYARRHGGTSVPYGDPGKINVQLDEAAQRGEEPFSLQWSLNGPELKGDQITSIVGNSSKIGNILAEGNRTTIERPLIQSLIPTIEFWRMRNLVKAIRNGISRNR